MAYHWDSPLLTLSVPLPQFVLQRTRYIRLRQHRITVSLEIAVLWTRGGTIFGAPWFSTASGPLCGHWNSGVMCLLCVSRGTDGQYRTLVLL
jgi:hypothetical protein